jgi:hypothetical protein
VPVQPPSNRRVVMSTCIISLQVAPRSGLHLKHAKSGDGALACQTGLDIEAVSSVNIIRRLQSRIPSLVTLPPFLDRCNHSTNTSTIAFSSLNYINIPFSTLPSSSPTKPAVLRFYLPITLQRLPCSTWYVFTHTMDNLK